MVSPPAETSESRDRRDAALVARVLRGGEDGDVAFRQLVLTHQAWLMRYLIYLLHDADKADEVAQQVFIVVYQRLREHRGSSFRGWIRRIATRRAFNYRRDTRTRRDYEARTPITEALQSPEEELASREALLVTLQQLPYPTREILVLRYVEELPVSEIAEHLDIGLSAAKMRLKRARDEFATVYREQVSNGHR